MFLHNPVRAQLFSTPVGAEFDIRNTLSCNILRANSFLARFYADLLRRRAANPSFLKDLEIQSGFFFNPDQPRKKCAGIERQGFSTFKNGKYTVRIPRGSTKAWQ